MQAGRGIQPEDDDEELEDDELELLEEDVIRTHIPDIGDSPVLMHVACIVLFICPH